MKNKRQKYDAVEVLSTLGVDIGHSESLVRIANRLHRWHELECGTDAGTIARGDDGELTWYNNRTFRWVAYTGPDYETAALRRLSEIMTHYPSLSAYVQSDPRGCSLYILRPGDVPEGGDPGAYYSRGIAVYREV